MTIPLDYDGWNAYTRSKLATKKGLRTFQERETWWCSVGGNVGTETYGKNKQYNRPALILRKHSKQLFFGIPLTSVIKPNIKPNREDTHVCDFKGKTQCALLSQARAWDSKRLSHNRGQMLIPEFEIIQNKFVGSLRNP